MKKMLMLSSVASMIDQFNMPHINLLQEKGYEVHVAANFEYGNTCSKQRVEEFKKELEKLGILYFNVEFSRNITKVSTNIEAYKQIKALMIENKYEFIHCHSPIGGVCGRIAAYSTNTKVIYTAHGFHFFKGAPMKNWFMYYPVERCLARYTDVLITINKEDYARAKKSFKAGSVEYIPGVGIDTKKFVELNADKTVKRRELGLPDDAFVVLSVGELNKNKNHEAIIKAVANLNNLNIFYVICGEGELRAYLEELTESLRITDRVGLLGFRTDAMEIYRAADVYVFPSYREGLSVALMEAMAAGLPVICSDIRGNTDLIDNGKGGYLVEPGSVDGFYTAISKIVDDNKLRLQMGLYNTEKIKMFDFDIVKDKMEAIYTSTIK